MGTNFSSISMAQLAVFNNTCLTRDILFRLGDAKDLARANCVLKSWRGVAADSPVWRYRLVQRWHSMGLPSAGYYFESSASSKSYAARANALCHSCPKPLTFFDGRPFLFTIDSTSGNFAPMHVHVGTTHNYLHVPQYSSAFDENRQLKLELVCSREDGQTWAHKVSWENAHLDINYLCVVKPLVRCLERRFVPVKNMREYTPTELYMLSNWKRRDYTDMLEFLEECGVSKGEHLRGVARHLLEHQNKPLSIWRFKSVRRGYHHNFIESCDQNFHQLALEDQVLIVMGFVKLMTKS